MSINDTMLTMGYPEKIIVEYNNWVLLLRKEQITMGSLILVAKDEVTKFSDLSISALVEMKNVYRNIEDSLSHIFHYDKINYLALMMKDKHVHYHIIPRYSKVVRFNNVEYHDIMWPKPPDLTKILDITYDEYCELQKYLSNNWFK